jgi:hypothetical protein
MNYSPILCMKSIFFLSAIFPTLIFDSNMPVSSTPLANSLNCSKPKSSFILKTPANAANKPKFDFEISRVTHGGDDTESRVAPKTPNLLILQKSKIIDLTFPSFDRKSKFEPAPLFP